MPSQALHEWGVERLTAVELLAGAALLPLVMSWDAWVARRVDSFAFAGDDERVLDRRQSIDFELPIMARSLGEIVPEIGGFPVPITVVNKWRLPHFSLESNSGCSVSLMGRPRSTRLAAAMLIALASFVRSKSLLRPDRLVPLAVQRFLYAIVTAEPPDALRLCAQLSTYGYEDAKNHSTSEWFQYLAGDEDFMGLAYELARGFVMIGLLETSPGARRVILKFSYHSYVVPARRDRYRTRLAHLVRWARTGARDVTDSIAWRPSAADQTSGGRIVLSSVCDLVSSRIHEGVAGIACARVSFEGPERRRRSVRLRVNSALTLEHAPPGRYCVEFRGQSGFQLDCPSMRMVEVRAGETTRVEVHAAATRVAAPLMLAPTLPAQPAFVGRSLARGFSWMSKPLAIRVRIGDGGAYHCEFEAPPGLHVTRARLVSNGTLPQGSPERQRELDLVLASTQRAHLYAPASGNEPATAYAYFNLRPRVETIARPAYWTAWVASAALLFVAATWRTHDGFVGTGPTDSSALLALILGAPSALAAYFAQSVPSRVANSILYGLRLCALLPAILSVLAAAVMLVGEHQTGAHEALWAIGILGVVVICALGATQRLAEHPREQRSRDLEQGRGFERSYSTAPRAGGADPTALKEASSSFDGLAASQPVANTSPTAIRDRLLERSDGLTRATRRMLLTQRGLLRREYKVPPALYFDSAETPPTFIGVRPPRDPQGVWSEAHALVDRSPYLLRELAVALDMAAGDASGQPA